MVRGSSAILNSGAASLRSTSSCLRASASRSIVRNFNTSNSLPSRPTRVWRNSTGPREPSLIARTIASSSGERITSRAIVTTRSNTRLSKRDEGDRPKPRTPSSTLPPRSSNSTEVPITSSRRGSTVTRTPEAVAMRTMSTTSSPPSWLGATITRSTRSASSTEGSSSTLPSGRSKPSRAESWPSIRPTTTAFSAGSSANLRLIRLNAAESPITSTRSLAVARTDTKRATALATTSVAPKRPQSSRGWERPVNSSA